MNPAMAVITSGSVQALEPAQQVGDRRGRREHDRRGDAEGALGHDVPRRPQPGLGQRHAEHVDARRPRRRTGRNSGEHQERASRSRSRRSTIAERHARPSHGQPRARWRRTTPNAQNASRGVTTTAKTKTTVAAIFTSGASRCTRESPGR